MNISRITYSFFYKICSILFYTILSLVFCLIQLKLLIVIFMYFFNEAYLFIINLDYKSKFKEFLKKLFKRLIFSLFFTFFLKSYFINFIDFFLITENVENATKSVDLTKIGLFAASAFALGYITFLVHRSFSNFVRDEVVAKVYMNSIVNDMQLYYSTYDVYVKHYIYFGDMLTTKTFFSGISNLDLHYRYICKKMFPSLLGLDVNDAEILLLKKCIDEDPIIITFDLHQLRMLALSLRYYSKTVAEHLKALTFETNNQLRYTLIKPHEMAKSLLEDKIDSRILCRMGYKDYTYSNFLNYVTEFNLNKGYWVATAFNDRKLTDLALRGMLDLSDLRYNRLKSHLPKELGSYSLQSYLPLLNQDNSFYQLISIGAYPIFCLFSWFGFVNPIPSEVFWHLVYKTPLNFVNTDAMKEVDDSDLSQEILDEKIPMSMEAFKEILDVNHLKSVTPEDVYARHLRKFLYENKMPVPSLNFINRANNDIYDEIRKRLKEKSL
jgi:hypothetical protein